MEKPQPIYKCFDAEGKQVAFCHEIDLTQALASGNFFRTAPGSDEGASGGNVADPARNYAAKSSDDIRRLCQARNIVGFLSMDKATMITALRERDAEDDARAAAARKEKQAKGKAEKTKAA